MVRSEVEGERYGIYGSEEKYSVKEVKRKIQTSSLDRRHAAMETKSTLKWYIYKERLEALQWYV